MILGGKEKIVDFETHDIGTAREIVLSRELANAVSQHILNYGVQDPELLNAYHKLMEHYEWQMSEKLT